MQCNDVEPVFAHGDNELRYAAEHFGFDLLNLDENDLDSDDNAANRESRKHRRSKKSKTEDVEVAEHIKDKTEQRQMEMRTHWTAQRAYATAPLEPVDTHWREPLSLHPRAFPDSHEETIKHYIESTHDMPVIPVHHDQVIPVIPIRHMTESADWGHVGESEEAEVASLERDLEIQAEKEHAHTRYHTHREEHEPSELMEPEHLEHRHVHHHSQSHSHK